VDPSGLAHALAQTQEKPLKADPAAQLALLDLQALDARADQLRHQRETVPELAEITELQATRGRLDDQRRDAQVSVDDLTAEQVKVDADVEQVKARRTRDQQRMDQGLISSPKDLERMQGELVSLQRRITSLEDDELEVMARLEDAQKDLDGLTAQVAAADERLAALTAASDEKAGVIDAELETISVDRIPIAGGLPEELLALYDRLRAQKGGVGAAALRARECGGCRLALDPNEISVIRSTPEDTVVRCEECQRILVRTPESGL
jgi:predicted  nucleic acid-binding Zn-ribbon protein